MYPVFDLKRRVADIHYNVELLILRLQWLRRQFMKIIAPVKKDLEVYSIPGAWYQALS